MKVPWIAKNAIADKASSLIAHFQSLAGYEITPPIPVEEIIERSLGLRLIYDDLEKKLGSRDILGAIYVHAKVICINERMFESSSEGRLVFTSGHEAGHWVLHRQYAMDRPGQDEGSAALVCHLKDAKKAIEWQADYFAACLLMPEKEVRKAFNEVCSLEPIVVRNVRGGSEPGRRSEEPFVEQWPYIAAAMCEAGGFSNVSKQAMIIRLQELGLLVNKTRKRMDWQSLE
jgi:Zn-dependent peptidase ImmA (M78 family)